MAKKWDRLTYHNVPYLLNRLNELGYPATPFFPEKCKDRKLIYDFIDGALEDLYVNKHYTIRDIAAALETTYATARLHLVDIGVELRSQGGPNNKIAEITARPYGPELQRLKEESDYPRSG